jgi:hypothetical protein
VAIRQGVIFQAQYKGRSNANHHRAGVQELKLLASAEQLFYINFLYETIDCLKQLLLNIISIKSLN